MAAHTPSDPSEYPRIDDLTITYAWSPISMAGGGSNLCLPINQILAGCLLSRKYGIWSDGQKPCLAIWPDSAISQRKHEAVGR